MKHVKPLRAPGQVNPLGKCTVDLLCFVRGCLKDAFSLLIISMLHLAPFSLEEKMCKGR